MNISSAPVILNRVQTVAYIPSSVDSEDNVVGQLNGHAVLVAIATNQLAVEKGAAIGMAGIDEENIDPLVTAVYENIAGQKLTLPVPVVASMLDKNRQLHRVTKSNQDVVYADTAERDRLEASGQAIGTTTISKANELALLTGDQLSDFGLIRLSPTSRNDLAMELDIAPNSLQYTLAEGQSWKAVRLNLPEYIDSATAKWSIRALRQQTSLKKVNLIILQFESNDGDFTGCMRLAQHLADYDPAEIQTVAFVKDAVVGPAAVLAMACDHLIMAPESRLGGRDDELESVEPLSAGDLEELKPMVVALAEQKETDWSTMMSMLDPSLIVTRYQNRVSRQIRLLGNEEFASLEDRDEWRPLGPIGGGLGISAKIARDNYLARTIAADMDEVEVFYQLESRPATLQPSPTDRWLEDVAAFLASPFVAPWLLFAGFFFFSTEMSAPGLGLPGFLAAICLVLFFWSQFLGGNADWVEVILFVVGVAFVAMEIFVVPGFGVFGIGGLLMIIVSLVLASQSFIIPMTSDEVRQLPYSLMPVLGAGFGMVVAAFALRKILPNSPYLKRLMLEPKIRVDTGLPGSDPEAVVDWSHLNGQIGETTTRLFPAGKARIGGKVYDVISKGQMVDKGAEIIVIEAIGNRVVVRAVDAAD